MTPAGRGVKNPENLADADAVASLGCDISCYCFWACLLIGRACPVCRMWFDRVRAKHYQILNTWQAQPIRKQRASQPNEATGRERSIPPHAIDVIFAPFHLTNEDEASFVRISPVAAIIFPLFNLSWKTREEGVLTRSDSHRFDLLRGGASYQEIIQIWQFWAIRMIYTLMHRPRYK